ncbi:MAG: redoxin domain-containing protein [Deltaproteobacteria bacterium]|nr:redoxin domain-containing protein [Deltaproteobacteria bacterium]
MGFRDLYGEFQNLRAVILGVSPDGEASHRKFIDKNDLPFPLLSIYLAPVFVAGPTPPGQAA